MSCPINTTGEWVPGEDTKITIMPGQNFIMKIEKMLFCAEIEGDAALLTGDLNGKKCFDQSVPYLAVAECFLPGESVVYYKAKLDEEGSLELGAVVTNYTF